MKADLTKIYDGGDLSGATAEVIYLPIVRDATLEKVSVRTNAAQVGDAVFEVRKNGAVITGLSALTIANGSKIGTVSGLDIELLDGDEITLNLISGNVSAPVTLNLAVDDGEAGGGATLPSGDLNAATNTVEKLQTVTLELPAQADLAAYHSFALVYNHNTAKLELADVGLMIETYEFLHFQDSTNITFDNSTGSFVKNSGGFAYDASLRSTENFAWGDKLRFKFLAADSQMVFGFQNPADGVSNTFGDIMGLFLAGDNLQTAFNGSTGGSIATLAPDDMVEFRINESGYFTVHINGGAIVHTSPSSIPANTKFKAAVRNAGGNLNFLQKT